MRTPEQLVKLVMADFKGTVLDTANVHLVLYKKPVDWEVYGYYLEVKVGTTEIAHHVGETDAVEADLIVGMADGLQTLVMDETNSAWPQITAADRTVVLDPHLNAAGVPVWGWLAGGEDYCTVGDLAKQRTL